MRQELEKHKDAFTYLAIGICIMVVGLIFLAIGALIEDILTMAGSFVVILVGLYLYDRGHHGRVRIRAIEHALAGIAPASGPSFVTGRADTKFCKHCGKVVAKDSSFCEHCGRRL